MSRNPRNPPAAPGFPPVGMIGKMPPMPPFLPPGFPPPFPGFPMPAFPGGPVFPPFAGALGKAPPPWPPIPPPGVVPFGPGAATVSNTNADATGGSAKNGGQKSSDWEEHLSDNGQTYWYNNATQVSVWEKPDELKSEIEKEERTPWREYLDDQGRKYYHHSESGQTQWTVPEEYKSFLERLEDRKKKAAEAAETPAEKMLKTIFPDEPLRNAFARCLMDRQMQSSWTWDQAVSATFEDDRSKALKMAERKQVYQLMVQKLRSFEIEERKRKDRKQEDDFFAMLDSWTEQDRYSTYKEMSDKFHDHSSFLAVPTERDRTRLFADYKIFKERKARDELRHATQQKIEAFRNYLSDSLNSDNPINTSTAWKDFRESHASHELFIALDPLDRLQTFADHIRQLERKEDEALAAERKKLRVTARKARESFRSLLIEKFSSPTMSHGSFHHSQNSTGSVALDSNTLWSQFLPFISSDPRYQNMLSVTGSTPAEMFYDYTAELHDKYLSERRKFKNAAKSLGLHVLRFSTNLHHIDPTSLPIPPNALLLTFDEVPKLDFKTWADKLRSHTIGVEEHTLRRIYNDFGKRELSKLQSRIQRARRHFTEMLEEKLDGVPTGELSLDSVRPLFTSQTEFSLIPDPDKEAIFEAFITGPRSQRGADGLKSSHGALESSAGPDAASTTEPSEPHEKVTRGRGAKRERHYDSDSSDSDRSPSPTGHRSGHRSHHAPSSSSSSLSTSPPRKVAKHAEDSTPTSAGDTVALPPDFGK